MKLVQTVSLGILALTLQTGNAADADREADHAALRQRAAEIEATRAKGLPSSTVMRRYSLRNSLIPVVTFLGADLATLMAGAVITEGIFNIPGIGQQLYQSIHLHESVVVVGIVTVLVIIYLIMNLLVDLLYGVLDPRIRYE